MVDFVGHVVRRRERVVVAREWRRSKGKDTLVCARFLVDSVSVF